MVVELETAPDPDLERCVCLTGHVAHLIRADAVRAGCGVGPVLRLSRMGDWQALWRAQAQAWELCEECVQEVGDVG